MNDIVFRNRGRARRHPATLIETPRKGTVIIFSATCACAFLYTRVRRCVRFSFQRRRLAKPLFQQVRSAVEIHPSFLFGQVCALLSRPTSDASSFPRPLFFSFSLSREDPPWRTSCLRGHSGGLRGRSLEIEAILGNDGQQRAIIPVSLPPPR